MERDLLQAVRPNIVQAIRAFRVEDLLAAAEQAGHHFLYANLADAQNKQDVLDMLAEHFLLASHFGKNMDALYDCMTDSVHKAGPQRGFVVVVEQIPDSSRFDREAREQLLDVFRDTSDYWNDRKVPFRCFYSIAVKKAQDNPWETVEALAEQPVKPTKNGVNAHFGLKMPMMSSAFDTSMWVAAA